MSNECFVPRRTCALLAIPQMPVGEERNFAASRRFTGDHLSPALCRNHRASWWTRIPSFPELSRGLFGVMPGSWIWGALGRLVWLFLLAPSALIMLPRSPSISGASAAMSDSEEDRTHGESRSSGLAASGVQTGFPQRERYGLGSRQRNVGRVGLDHPKWARARLEGSQD